MRLTLRTLLAYLDRTLDKESSETLHGKVMESSFASQLIKRIKVVLSSPTVGALSPVAAGPVEEANVMSEYLDSTLPNEQVAEIERACLESDPLLAEAAACHQVLTLVLGKPAEVSPALRERIYELPNSDAFRSLTTKETRPLLTNESFASIAIPEDATLGLGTSGLDGGITSTGFGPTQVTADPAPSGALTSPRKPPMRPVGPSDSGVSDAPTRLRKAGLVDDPSSGVDSKGKAIAGSKPRQKGLSDLSSGGIRTSRITPWLVSLALAGVLLFALSQLFAPLLNRRTALLENDPIEAFDGVASDTIEPASASELADVSNDSSISASAVPEIEVPAEAAPPMIEVGSSTRSANAPIMSESANVADAANLNDDKADTLPPPVMTAIDTPAIEAVATVEASPSATMPTVSKDEEPEGPQSIVPATMPDSIAVADLDSASKEMAVVAPETVPTVSIASPEPGSTAEPKTDVADQGAVTEVSADVVANLTTERTLVAARSKGGEWQVIPSGGSIPANTELVCAPTFRARLEGTDGLDLTMAGPTQLGFVRKDADATLYLAGGRILLRHKTPNTAIQLSLSGRPISVRFKSADTLVAVKLEHLREPGADPLVEAARVRSATLMIVQGAAELTSAGATSLLDTGQQIQLMGNDEPVQSAVKEIEEWIDEPDPNETSLESLARSGLLSMISDTQPLELTLREAIPFRRAEVGSLAGRTLLWIGRGDIYFGRDGILNQPRQKAYWKDHYRSLLAVVNQSIRSAAELKSAILQMEAADGAQLFQLLTGYSQEQLKGGGDAQLVKMLNSPTMAVRALALENLSEITGTTLNYRVDQENAIRRATDVKKWEARVRKGDIRWPEEAELQPNAPVGP